jgi:hypothetical protein
VRRQITAVLLCVALAASGCASTSGPRVAQDSAAPLDRALLAEYAQRIPTGSRVRVERTTGGTLRGTLLKTGSDQVTLQRNTRIPEPPVDIPFGSITRLTVENGGNSTGKTVAIAVGTGIGATFGVLLLLAALFSE